MADMLRYQIGVYIALVTLFGSLSIAKNFSFYVISAYVLTTVIFVLEMGIWGYYFMDVWNISYKGSFGESVLIIQHVLVVVLTILLGAVATMILASPDLFKDTP